MGVNSLPKTVTRQRRGCDLNPGPSAPESSTLTTRLPSHALHTPQDGHPSKYQPGPTWLTWFIRRTRLPIHPGVSFCNVDGRERLTDGGGAVAAAAVARSAAGAEATSAGAAVERRDAGRARRSAVEGSVAGRAGVAGSRAGQVECAAAVARRRLGRERSAGEDGRLRRRTAVDRRQARLMQSARSHIPD